MLQRPLKLSPGCYHGVRSPLVPNDINVTFRLRSYTSADFDPICAIDRACYSPEIAYSRREMRGYLNAPGAECIVAESESGMAGFCITACRRVGYIVTIDVLEEFRRQGLGTALLFEAENRLAGKGVRVVTLDTATDNASAIAFWQKHGYRTIGRRKGYYPNGIDAFAMTKALAP